MKKKINIYIFYLNRFSRVRSAYEVKQRGKLFEAVKFMVSEKMCFF